MSANLNKKLLLLILSSSFSLFGELSYEEIWSIHKESYPAQTAQEREVKIKEERDGLTYTKFPKLSNLELAETAFQILEDAQTLTKTPKLQNNIISDSAYQDYNFFYGNKKFPTKHILNQINRTKTKFGYARLAKKLTEITNNQMQLEQTQKIIQQLNHPEIFYKLSSELASFGTFAQPSLALFFNHGSQIEATLACTKLYFSLFPKNINESLNKNKNALVLGQFMEKLSEINVIALSAVTLTSDTHLVNLRRAYDRDTRLSQRQVASIAAPVFFTIGNSIKDIGTIALLWTQNHNSKQVIETFGKQILGVKHALNMCKNIYKILAENQFLLNDIEHVNDIKLIFDNPSKNLKDLLLIFEKKRPYQWEILAAFKLILECKEELAKLIQAVAQVDMYLSLATFYKENQNGTNKVCLPKYFRSKVPYINANNIWNIFVGPKNSVPNSIKLGAAVDNKIGYNAILTGANESGKSTFQKSLFIDLMLAQSVGIALAESLDISLFDMLKYYQNISDDVLSGKSLFRAQAEQFNNLFQIDTKKISFISSDEPATGANARICSVIAFSAAKKLENIESCTAIISTHFPLLTKLEDSTKGFFKNYKFEVKKIADAVISYSYKLSEGKSDQHIELDIFAREGLDRLIILNAKQMLESGQDLQLLSSL